jgi:exodeoxyribonuclease VII large subunit
MTTLPERAADTTAEQPWPVRLLSMKIGEYVEKMSTLWVEGQVVQLNRRPGARTAFLTLRDPDVDMSLSVSIHVNALDAMPTPLGEGARVVLQAKPTFWAQARIAHARRPPDPPRRRRRAARAPGVPQATPRPGGAVRPRAQEAPALPPRRVGLVCGRASAAERDVVENARRRWPSAVFEIRQVAVQGADAVSQVCAALAELDAHPEVDVIVIARGGGGVEDLLPFSNESMVRAVAAAVTPVVSAIGHDVDTPLLDLVADHRASTPTDCRAKAIVPDADAERSAVAAARARGHRAPHCATAPRTPTAGRAAQPAPSSPTRARSCAASAPWSMPCATAAAAGSRPSCTGPATTHAHLRTQVRTLSPQSTLEPWLRDRAARPTARW